LSENYFKDLYDVDVNKKKKTKNGLNYLSWAACWAEVKKMFPEAFYTIYEQHLTITETIDNKTIERKVGRPWFDDGRTGWVRTGVTINGIEHIEALPIMDFKNKSIPADSITSADANKSIQRSLTKACARHGLGLYIYEGEDLPEETKEVTNLQAEILEIIKKKAALSDEAKEKVAKTCKEADANANGDPRLIDDVEVLRALKKSLMAIRK
jgi:hypothetical protein